MKSPWAWEGDDRLDDILAGRYGTVEDPAPGSFLESIIPPGHGEPPQDQISAGYGSHVYTDEEWEDMLLEMEGIE